ncbi:5-formyltetrahydrofolate cyclo-ligase [Daejeonella sp.]|uniref:5-formyltetrahydrofolate cyclo-ligase n=1 Tax=Daejeonella sp. TaxID=2805397 RepID=UPI003982E05F
MDKDSIRQKYLDQRLKLPHSRYWMLTDEIMEEVKRIDWQEGATVHIFLPIRKNNEVDTFSILNYFKLHNPQLKIVVPRTDFENLSIINILYDHEFTILGRNKYDIPEPIHGKTIPTKEIDVVFIPLLAFDIRGNRVGYGKGFYDRFLSECRSDVLKIGLSLFDPVEVISDINEFDIPLDWCITPGKTWNFNIRQIQ